MTMKMQLRLVYADGDAAATLPRPRRWSYAFDALLYPFYLKSEVHMIYVPLKVNDRRDQVALLQLAIMNLDDRRSRQDGVGGPKGPGTSMIIRRQTAAMWALWPLILIRAMSMEGGYLFFNYMRMEPLRIGPIIQKSDTNFRRALEQGLESARTPRA